MARQRIGRYDILESVGTGGFATVYRAQDSQLGRQVALKVLHPHMAGDSQYLDRFLREARLAASIPTHPNVVVVHEVGQESDTSFIAMEFLPSSLENLLRQQGRLPIHQALDIARQASLGLQAAHNLSIVHRDIKPANILLTSDGTPKVSDFGIAQAIGLSPLTATGQTLGSPHYMAPEQGERGQSDARSDIYSLGCVLYRMLTGEVPFDAETPFGVLRQHVDSTPTPVRQLRPEVPAAVEQLVNRCLAKNPDQRFQSAGQLSQALVALLETVPQEAGRQVAAGVSPAVATMVGTPGHSSTRKRFGRPWMLGAIGVVAFLAAVGALFGLAAAGSGDGNRHSVAVPPSNSGDGSLVIAGTTPNPTPSGFQSSASIGGSLSTPVPSAATASFSVDLESGKAPVVATFTNTSSGEMSSVEWDFGDGNNSKEQNPEHVYTVAGTYTVQLTVSGPGGTKSVANSDLISVHPGAAVSMEVSPPSATIAVQDSAQFTVVARDEFGNVVSVTPEWAVVAEGGSIDTQGRFVAETQAGSFSNTVKASLQTDSAELEATGSVTVEPGPLSNVVLEPRSTDLGIGATQPFSVSVIDEFGNHIPNVQISWIVPEAGTISAEGILTAGTKSGSYQSGVVVEAIQGPMRASASADVTIQPDPLANINVQPSPAIVKKGETVQLTATGLDKYENVIPGLEYLWTRPGFSEENSSGLFRAGNEEGLSEIQVRASYKNSEQMGSVTLAIPPVWVPVGDMTWPRNEHTATLLPDGKVLIVGGSGGVRGGELYDPTTHEFTRVSSLSANRLSNSATILSDGKVLIVGGCNSGKGDLYDPQTEIFVETAGGSVQPRLRHSATLLENGKVLIVGGGICPEWGGTSDTAELYDPVTGTFSPTSGNLSAPRRSHRATLLSNGKVLITGGRNVQADGSILCPNVAELYDPVTDTFRQTGSLIQRGYCTDDRHSNAVLFPDGRVLLAMQRDHVELYDPEIEQFTIGGAWADGCTHSSTLTQMPDGLVLISGGRCEEIFDGAVLFDPVQSKIVARTTMTSPRSQHTSTLLPGGEVLITGGRTLVAPGVYNNYSSAELFIP